MTVRATDPDGLSAVDSFSVSVTLGTRDYDRDDDDLIEVSTLAQLDAIRYDSNGNGVVDDPSDWPSYFAAFTQATGNMGCSSRCVGYELTADLDFDTDSSGGANDGDTYWNGGDGWEPIGPMPTRPSSRATATPLPTCSSTVPPRAMSGCSVEWVSSD